MHRGALALVLASLSACGGHQRPPPARAEVPAARRHDAPDDDAAVAGVVETPAGSAAANAIVALNGVKGERIVVSRADAQGRFRAPRPKERFAITATGDGGTAVFVAPADAVTRGPLRLRLAEVARGLTLEGTLSTAGATPPDTMIAAARHGPDEGDIFYAPVSASGAFTLHVPPGRYTVHLGSDGFITRPVHTDGAAGQRAKVAVEASLRAPAPEEVVRWLAGRALPMATAEPRTDDEDLAPVAALLAGARVIGAGEATHGTREYFRIKHRLLKRLVAHHGVTMLAMEANFSDAERVDAWVQTGQGTVEQAMRGLFVVWRTEEVRDLLVWMREWNADPKHRRKLRFRGYDVQGTRAAMTALRAYVRKVDPAAESDLLGPLAALDADTDARGMLALGEAESAAARDAVARLLERLAGARPAYVARSSAAAHAVAMQHARVLEQARARFAAKDPHEQFAARDRGMAENVAWLVEQVPKDERVMVWAHNGHVQLDATNLLGANMGSRLRDRFGSGYLSVGFVLDEGTYRAWVKPNEPTLADVALGPREPGWAAEAFARVGQPMFAVDLRGAPSGPVRDWLFAPHVVHSCGWLVSEPERKGAVDALGRLFDVALYVSHTTSARQLPRRP